MKKVLILLLVFALIGPVVGFACDCCPASHPKSTGSSYESSTHDCCSTLDIHQDKCGISEIRQFAPSPSRILISPLVIGTQFVSASDHLNRGFHFDLVGPSSLSADTPLYLLNRVLRL